jgi:hypothetical protein
MEQQPLSRRELRERDRPRSPVTALVIGAIVLAVVAAGLWFGRGLLTAESPESPRQAATTGSVVTSTSPTTSPATATPSTTVTVDPLAAAVADCKVAWKLQTAATAAAWTSLSQWNNHLYIMNRLQAGKVTLAKAKELWVPTTTKAAENVAAFRTADQALTSAKVACKAPAETIAGEQAAALRQCAGSSDTLNAALKAARITIAFWETHLKDQSHFKAGQVSSAAAEAAWRALWKKGVATIPAYLAAQKRVESARCVL